MVDDAMTPRGRFLLKVLTRREREILPLVCAGFSNRKIAERILIGDQVAKNYLRGLFKKIGVKSRHELVVFCWRHGIVACPCEARSQFLKSETVSDVQLVDARTEPKRLNIGRHDVKPQKLADLQIRRLCSSAAASRPMRGD